MDKKVSMPLSKEDALSLSCGDYVYLTGTIYTARDAAHKRMYEALRKGEEARESAMSKMAPGMGGLF